MSAPAVNRPSHAHHGALARLAATIELAHEQLESGDVALAGLTLRAELASPLLSGGEFYA